MRRRRKKTFADVAAVPLLVTGAAMVAADLGRRFYRHTQIFCPSPDPLVSWNPADYGIDPEAVEEHWIETPDGERLHAWYCRAESPRASGVFCHGNTGNLTISAPVIPHLLNAGFNVLFFDYRGFGRSSGRASFSGVVADGVTAARYHETLRPQHLPSVLYGFSLGGAIAAQVIRRHPFDALILQSTFTSLPQITRVLFPRLPLHLVAGNVFDTVSVLRRLEVPLLVMHGTDDEVIPCWMAHELHAACASPKRIHCVEGALHKDMFERDPDAMVWQISQFLAEVRTRETPHAVEPPPAVERWMTPALAALRRITRRRTAQQV